VDISPIALAQLRDQHIVAAIGNASWHGTGYGTFPEVFRNTARSAIAAAGGDVTIKRGLYRPFGQVLGLAGHARRLRL
jgi:hypothetical protein